MKAITLLVLLSGLAFGGMCTGKADCRACEDGLEWKACGQLGGSCGMRERL